MVFKLMGSSGWGGARPGAGRKRGGSNRDTRYRRRKIELVAQQIADELGDDCFEGDAHAYLMSIYKDEKIPMLFRLDAAKACLPFEKPRLASVEVKPPEEQPPLIAGVEYEIIDPKMAASSIERELARKVESSEPVEPT